MPRTLPWRELGCELGADDADAILATFKSYSTDKSNSMPCTVCCAGDHHSMRYKLLKCESATCSDLMCSWRGKILVCSDSDEAYIYELGDHYTGASSPKRAKLSRQQKEFCRELSQQRLRPLRIQHAMARKFLLPVNDIPALGKVQNFCNYYNRTELDNHDSVDDLARWIHARAFTGEEDDNETFTFAWDVDADGKPVVGDGSDEEPFVIGLITKALVRKLSLPPDSYILFMDATFKLNTSDYPVIVVGISDRARSFHLVAVFIVSQRLEPIYEACLASLSRLYSWITNKTLVPRYVMGDAEKAQRNAMFTVFHHDPSLQYLMCFFPRHDQRGKEVKGISLECGSSIGTWAV